MNTPESIQPYIQKLLDGGMKSAEEAVKFIETQAPELMRETVLWGWVSEIAAPIVGLLIILFSVLAHFACRKNENFYSCKKADETPDCVLVALIFLVGLIIFAAQIGDVIYPLVAPRVFLIEKISQFIK